MMTNTCARASNEQLTLYFYGELPADEERALDEHVAVCQTCAAAIVELQLVRSALAARAAAATQTAGEWDAFMARLLPKLDGAGASAEVVTGFRPGRISRWPALALAASLLIAVGGGLMWQRAALGPAGGAVTGAGSSEATLDAAAARHFERAKLVLLGIATKDPSRTSASDWEYERELAASLLPETRLFRLSASDLGDAGLASLLGDLENVLLQAAMTSDATSSELERLQRVIRRRDLLVRMDLREL